MYEKFHRVAAQAVEAGDICAVCGIDDIQVEWNLSCTDQLSASDGIC